MNFFQRGLFIIILLALAVINVSAQSGSAKHKQVQDKYNRQEVVIALERILNANNVGEYIEGQKVIFSVESSDKANELFIDSGIVKEILNQNKMSLQHGSRNRLISDFICNSNGFVNCENFKKSLELSTVYEALLSMDSLQLTKSVSVDSNLIVVGYYPAIAEQRFKHSYFLDENSFVTNIKVELGDEDSKWLLGETWVVYSRGELLMDSTVFYDESVKVTQSMINKYENGRRIIHNMYRFNLRNEVYSSDSIKWIFNDEGLLVKYSSNDNKEVKIIYHDDIIEYSGTKSLGLSQSSERIKIVFNFLDD